MPHLSRRVRIAIRWSAVLAGVALGGASLLFLYGVALVDGAVSGRGQRPATRVLGAAVPVEPSDGWDVPSLRRCLLACGVPERFGGEPGAGEFAVGGGSLRLGRGVTVAGEPLTVTCRGSGVVLAGPGGAAVRRAELRPAVVGATAPDDVVRWPVSLAAMAPALLTAVVDIEDRGFLSHSGLSVRGLLRAAAFDLVHGGARQGGSTITQQLAKILLLKPSRTIPRKVIEAWLATLLEYRYDKRTILQAYLNRVYLGQDGGWQIHGAEAASHYFFGKRAADLGLAEAALVAGLIAAPNRFDPVAHPDAARARRGIVLAAMVEEGHIEAAAAAAAAREPLPAQPRRLRVPAAAQFVEHLLAGAPRQGDLATTLDPTLQEAVFEGCRAGVGELESRHARLRELGRGGDPIQVAVVALAPDGRLLAVQGSRDGLPGEFNRALSARRQIGSLVKPFIVAAALDAGWAPDAELLDEPIAVPVGRAVWRPQNSDGRFRGAVTVRDALVHSLNVPVVRLGLGLSVRAVAATLRRAGLQCGGEAPAVLLGAVEATPVEVGRAFAAFVNRGGVPAVRTGAGMPPRSDALFSGAASATVREILEDVPRSGTAAVLAGSVRGRLAAKTGTTDERRDSWFVALRPRLVTVVWVGTDGNRETGLYGATGALQVWRAIEERLPPGWRAGEF